nr:fatty acid--CoA ligase [Polyangiaceae bacterium]
AFVLPKSEGADEALSTASIRDALRGELAVYKLPKEVRVVADFPRNAMGKVMKKELRGT